MKATSNNSSPAIRYRRILGTLLTLFLLMWGSIAALLYLAAISANQQSKDASLRAVTGYLAQRIDELESQVRIYAYWEDGIDHLAAESVDPTWATREMGPDLLDPIGINLWFTLNPATKPAFVIQGTELIPPKGLEISEHTLSQLRLLSLDRMGPPPEPVSVYARVEGVYYLLSAAALVIESRPVARNQAWILAFGRPLHNLLQDITTDQGIDLSVSDEPAPESTSRLSLPIQMTDGTPAWIHWDIQLVGYQYLRYISPWVGALFLLTLLLCGFLLRRVAEMYRVLRLSENRFRDAIEALPDGFVIYDHEDRLAAWNERYSAIYARSEGAIKAGNRFEDIIRYGFEREQYRNSSLERPDDNLEQRIVARLEAHNDPRGAFEQQLGDGRWIRVVEQRMSDGGIVSFRYDISELKHRESELIEARRVAETANEAKSRFLASVSHEVRTPLNALLGFLELLHEAPLPSDARDHLNIARHSGEHLLTIIDNLLDFSQIEAGSFDLRVAPFDPRSVLDSVTGMLKPLADQRGLRLEVIGNLTCPVLLGDEARLRQVLLNLVCNGLKFTEAGGVVLHVEQLADDQDHSTLRFTVKDTGIGIDAKQIDAIFKPFFQAQRNKLRSQGGIGLGLPISQKILQSMGGELEVSSSPGHGSQFCFTMPFEHAPLSGKVPAGQKTSAPPSLPSATNTAIKVLIADDVEPNRKLLAAMLRGSRYRPIFATNGLEAFATAKEVAPDVILMDVSMPEMDGLQATAAIRREMGEHSAPVIALTASAMKGDRERFLNAGMNDYLSKPVSKAALLAVLARWTTPGVDLSGKNENATR